MPVHGLGAGLLAAYLVLTAVVSLGVLLSLWPTLETLCFQPLAISSESPQKTPTGGATAFANAGTVPELRAVEPRSGPGGQITLRGGGFTRKVSIQLGEVKQPGEAEDPGTIHTTIPSQATGSLQIKVLNEGDTTTGSAAVTYQYREPKPVKISAVSPSSGPVDGNVQVLLRGSGFLEKPSVTFDGVKAPVIQGSDEVVFVQAPPHPAGTADVEVRNSDGQSAVLKAAYTFSCPAAYELRIFLAVLLAGVLGATLHAMRSLVWYFGNKTLVRSWTLLYVLLPFMGGLVAAAFYLILRAGLWKPEQSGTTMVVVGIAILVGVFSEQAIAKLKAITEALLTEAPKGANQAPPAPPAAPAPGVQAPAKSLASVAPGSGSVQGGDLIFLAGQGFAESDKVTLDKQPAVSRYISATSLAAVTPAHPPGRVDVTVTDIQQTSRTLPRAYLYTPVSPGSGSKAGGAKVTIRGAGFNVASVPIVNFGTQPATHVVVVDGSTLTAQTPQANQEGAVDVTVVDAGVTLLSAPEGFRYTA